MALLVAHLHAVWQCVGERDRGCDLDRCLKRPLCLSKLPSSWHLHIVVRAEVPVHTVLHLDLLSGKANAPEAAAVIVLVRCIQQQKKRVPTTCKGAACINVDWLTAGSCKWLALQLD